MNTDSTHRIPAIACRDAIRLLLGACAVLVLLAHPLSSTCLGAAVSSGWELLATDGAFTHLPIGGNQEFQGAPLGTFDFGGSIGVRPVGNADAILRRTLVSSDEWGSTYELQLAALQLMSVSPFDGGAGVDHYYITLAEPGVGTMFVWYPGGMQIPDCANPNSDSVYDSSLEVGLNLRKGSVTGPIVESVGTQWSNMDCAWMFAPPDGALVIPGVNEGFWASCCPPPKHFLVVGSSGQYGAYYAVPEPRHFALSVAVMLLAGGLVKRRARASYESTEITL
jgi:hypothetical protein